MTVVRAVARGARVCDHDIHVRGGEEDVTTYEAAKRMWGGLSGAQGLRGVDTAVVARGRGRGGEEDVRPSRAWIYFRAGFICFL